MDKEDGIKSTRVSRWFNVHVHKVKRSKASTPTSSNALEPETSKQFFRERAGSHHAAFAEPTQWDDQEGKWKAEERLAVEYLEEVLHSHDEDAGPDEPKFSDCSWATVFKEIASAKAEHSAQSDASKARLLGIDLTTQAIDSLLPDEYGLKVIKGTLGLIFESKDTAAAAQTVIYYDMAAIKKEQIREEEHYRQLWEAQQKEYRRLEDYNRMLSDQNRELSNENEILRVATPRPAFTSSGSVDDVLEALISSIELLGILGVRPEQAWDDLKDAVLQGPNIGDNSRE
ncbi:hypothetical protein N656DRAFT_798218 [Canariomyces notabilis]|uniref:Uncharacterized protein n=1 Tax=Canariomyces notabilis TaxID=2074819 RepID=A0AAN6TE49_9PEZI|nr:hypothetical protein N656DRAFT_798218 [Canariomyces arenarius]